MIVSPHPGRAGSVDDTLREISEAVEAMQKVDRINGVFAVIVGHEGHETIVSFGENPYQLREYLD